MTKKAPAAPTLPTEPALPAAPTLPTEPALPVVTALPIETVTPAAPTTPAEPVAVELEEGQRYVRHRKTRQCHIVTEDYYQIYQADLELVE